MVHVSLADGYSFWLFTLYGASNNAFHADFWQELDDLAGLGGEKWVIGGNFNVTRCGRNLTIAQSHLVCVLLTNEFLITNCEIFL